MTDAEILKALECCGSTTVASCKGCPMYKDTSGICVPIICRDALDLINRQKAEIEQWKEEANRYQNLWCESDSDIHKIKLEAIKMFAERILCEDFEIPVDSNTVGYLVDRKDIERLLEELESENKC